MVVSGINAGDRNLTPDYFIQRHGLNKVTVINTRTHVPREVNLEEFMAKLRVRDDDGDPEKLKVQ